MSLSKELSTAKVLSKKISDAQREIRTKTLALKIGEQEQASSVDSLLKPVSEPLKKLAQIKEKKAKYWDGLREKYMSTNVKRERTSTPRLLPSLLKRLQTDSPRKRESVDSPETEYGSPLSNWDFDSPSLPVQTPDISIPATSSQQSPIDYDRKLLDRQYNQTVFENTPSLATRRNFKSPLSVSMPNSPKPSVEARQKVKFLERARESPSSAPVAFTALEEPSFPAPRDSLQYPNNQLPDIEAGGKESLMERFLKLHRDRAVQIDKATGVKSKEGKFYLGKKEISFLESPQALIDIDGEKYPMTRGLLELLFLKQPNEENVTSLDERSYKKIIEQTKLEPLSSKINKYVGTGLQNSPMMMIDTSTADGNTTFTYWNDVNELVDRLLLLKKSQAAGNDPSYGNNEILSILDELREDGYIY